MTYRDVCEDALRKIGVIAQDTSATAEEMETARRSLERMLKAWQKKGYAMSTLREMSVPLVPGRVQTLDPVRPLEIYNARLKLGEIETPICYMDRTDYDALPNKNSAGRPTSYHYDRQAENARLLVWPAYAAGNGDTLEITYVKEYDDIVLADAPEYPGEWADAVVYGLADRLTSDFMVNAPDIPQRAMMYLSDALGFDREQSVYFS